MGSSTESISRSKRALREAWKASFPRDPEVRATASYRVSQLLALRSEFQQATNIALFAGRSFEIDLMALFQLAPRPYAFPSVDSSTRELRFYLINDPSELSPGNLGILEPPEKKATEVKWGKDDLVLVPGFAFDCFGTRIGSGAGYYDRFFARVKLTHRWGIGFQQQFHHQELAHSPHDVRMQAIVTDSGFFPAKKVEI